MADVSPRVVSSLGTWEPRWRSPGLEAGVTPRGRAWGRVGAPEELAQLCSSAVPHTRVCLGQAAQLAALVSAPPRSASLGSSPQGLLTAPLALQLLCPTRLPLGAPVQLRAALQVQTRQ